MAENETQPVSERVFTLAHLKERKLAPMRWAIERLIPEGLTILAGPPKIGKSWLTLEPSAEIPVGGQVLGFPTVQGAVLHLALEDSERRLQDRLKKVINGGEWPEGCVIHLDWPKLADGGYAQLDGWLTANPHIRLVTIDTLARIRPAHKAGGNAYDEDYLLTGNLQSLALRHHVAILAVMHTRKGIDNEDVFSEVSGTLGLNGGADAILVLKRPRNVDDGTLHITGRDMEERQLAVHWNPLTGRWTVTGEAETVIASNTRTAILDALRRTGEMSPGDVAAMTRLSPNTIRQTMLRMVGDGAIRRASYGRYVLNVISTPRCDEVV